MSSSQLTAYLAAVGGKLVRAGPVDSAVDIHSSHFARLQCLIGEGRAASDKV